MGSRRDDDEEDGGTIVDFDPTNRRQQPRVEAELKVEYHSLDEFVVAYTEDISRGGLFLATEALLAVGSVVRLSLVLPNDGPTVAVIARVAYVLEPRTALARERRAGMGMEFLDIEGGPLADQLDAYLTLQAAEEHRPAHGGRAATIDVLLAEPEDEHRAQCVALLRRIGHRVSTASNGIEALGMVLKVPPDAIVADVDLPGMDGWHLLRLVRERPSIAHIPFILRSTRNDDATRLRAYQVGADDIISKPTDATDLAARIERAVDRAQQPPRRQNTRNALRGDLGQVGLGSVLSFIELEKRSGQMLVVRGEAIATLHIVEGGVVHVDMPSRPELAPLDRLFAVLDWQDGQFELTAMTVTANRTIEMPTGYALMEHARRSDEKNR